MKKLFQLVLFCSLALLSLNAQERIPKVLLLGIDGIRPDAIPLVNTPNLDTLMANGTYSFDAFTEHPSLSGVGFSTMLTGVWSNKHNVTSNTFVGARFDLYPHIFVKSEQWDPTLHTVSVNAFGWAELIGHTQGIVDSIITVTNFSDTIATLLAGNYLTTQDPDMMFVYLIDADHAGHAHGFTLTSPEYMESVRLTDQKIGVILDSVRARPNYANEDWLILVTTDHGGTNTKHNTGSFTDRNIFIIASGDSIPHMQISRDTQMAVIDKAMEFDGVGTYAVATVDSPFNFQANQEWSIEVRVKSPGNVGNPAIISNKNWSDPTDKGFTIATQFPNGPLWLANMGDGVKQQSIFGKPITDNKWHHLTVVMANNRMTIFQDGFLIGSQYIGFLQDITTPYPLVIGQHGTQDLPFHFNGLISEVRIWGTKIEDDEIAAYAYKELDANHPKIGDLIAYWKMDTATGTLIPDNGPNNIPLQVMNDTPTIINDGTPLYTIDYSNSPTLVDAAKTALNHMCIPDHPDWDLDGNSIIGKLCYYEPCDSMSNIWVDNITPTSATLRWDTTPSADFYTLKGYIIGTPIVIPITLPGGLHQLHVTGLQPNTSYGWQIQPHCDAEGFFVGPYSAIDTFSTVFCDTPMPIFVSHKTETTVRLNWTNTSSPIGYEIIGRPLTTTSYIKLPISGETVTHFDVIDLVTGVDYEWTVRSNCGGGYYSSYAPFDTFRLTDMPDTMIIPGDTTITAIDTIITPADTSIQAIDTTYLPGDTTYNAIDTSITCDTVITMADTVIIQDTLITAADTTVLPPDTTIAPDTVVIIAGDTIIMPPDTIINPPVVTINPPDTTIAPDTVLITPADTTITPADTTIVPADTTVIPADTTITPGDTIITPSDTTYVPADTLVAPDTIVITPPDTIITPADTAFLPADTTIVPDSVVVTPADTIITPADTAYTPADTIVGPDSLVIAPGDTIIVAADTIYIPADTIIFPPDTIIGPPDTVITPGDTFYIPPDTIYKPADTVITPGDTVIIQADTIYVPADTTFIPPDSYDITPPDTIYISNDTIINPPDTVIDPADTIYVPEFIFVFPDDTTIVPGDTTIVLGDTIYIVADTIIIPPDTIILPPDTTIIPGEITYVPPDTIITPADTSYLPPDTTVIPGDTLITPADTVITPPDTTITPADTTIHPGATTITPADTVITPPDTTVAPADTTITPQQLVITPADTIVVPADTTIAPADTTILPGDTIITPGDTVITPGDTTFVPADTTITPPDTTILPGDTTITPGSTVITPADTSIVPVDTIYIAADTSISACDTTVTYDTLITAPDTIITLDTIYTPADTMIVYDTVITPPDTIIIPVNGNKFGSTGQGDPETSGMEAVWSSQLDIYPNPFTTFATVRFDNPDNEIFRMVITDLSGKQVRVREGIAGDTMRVDKDDLSTGIYYLELIGQRTLRAKIIIN